MDDERAPTEPRAPDEAADDGAQAADRGAQSPLSPRAAEAGMATSGAIAAGEATGTAALKADVTAAWSKLDQTARLLVGASAAAFVLVLAGLPLSVWDSAPFALLVLVASTITGVTGWFGGHAVVRTMPIPLPTIESIATLVAAILGVLKAVEVLFELDSDGIIALILAVALAVVTVAMVVAATRRGADPRRAIAGGDQGTKIAAVGLVLVLLGWAFNLSISFWTMGQAALPLAVLTVAALTIAEAPRIQSPVPVAWVGAAIAAFGAILVIGHWGDLTRLGNAQLELDPGDFLGFLGYTAGTVLIIAGGVLSGRSQWTPRVASATPAAPLAPAEPPTRGEDDETAV